MEATLAGGCSSDISRILTFQFVKEFVTIHWDSGIRLGDALLDLLSKIGEDGFSSSIESRASSVLVQSVKSGETVAAYPQPAVDNVPQLQEQRER